MNPEQNTPQPETPAQPTNTEQSAPVAQPVAAPAANPAPRQSSGLAITSMVLGIVSIVLFIVWFIAIPLGITALILGIVALVKRKPGKGMSITGIVTGGVTVLIIGPLLLLAVVAYNGVVDRANEAQQRYESSRSQKELFN